MDVESDYLTSLTVGLIRDLPGLPPVEQDAAIRDALEGLTSDERAAVGRISLEIAASHRERREAERVEEFAERARLAAEIARCRSRRDILARWQRSPIPLRWRFRWLRVAQRFGLVRVDEREIVREIEGWLL